VCACCNLSLSLSTWVTHSRLSTSICLHNFDVHIFRSGSFQVQPPPPTAATVTNATPWERAGGIERAGIPQCPGCGADFQSDECVGSG
jgi:hypothetical protein